MAAPAGRTPFEEFFGEDFFRRFFGDTPERMPQRSLGSGVIIDPSGIALTNSHVVEKATEIEVTTLDGSKHKAKVIGNDRKTDLAVLKLDDGKGKFAFARLGDSDKMQVGDWVIAVGSPFGLQATVTAGIISAKARQILKQGPSTTSYRPTPPSIPATPAARSSTCKARSSASTRRSSPAAPASASPSPPTWRGRSRPSWPAAAG